ncbi:MAG: BTAD domain-containing putative transcriptional regulator [Anaerolineales bacterium]|jgi:predicted ATPase/DNA-binding SARP family transcriptional activator
MLEAQLLGKFEVRLNGQPIDLASRPAQSLLAYLLLNPNQPIRREKLAGLIWPNSTESNARSNLRHALWRVRKSFGPDADATMHADDLTIWLQLQRADWVDTNILDTSVQDDVSSDQLIEIVSVYGGELLPGFYEDWVAAERERLKAVYERKMNVLVNRLVSEDQWEEVLRWGERWISLSLAPEAAYRALMVAHAGRGELGKVAEVYQRCALALEWDLEVKPSKRTEELYQTIMESGLTRVGHQAEAVKAGIKAAGSRNLKSNLPHFISSFIGREKELEDLKRRIQDSRLVTLTGAGGSGKTRLAVQVANDLVSQYGDGVWFVNLAPLSNPEEVYATVASVLDIHETHAGPLPDLLVNNLYDKRVLLVLDNCEHLVQVCAELAENLLLNCPRLRILATSRERLAISGEINWNVPPLSLPDSSKLDPAELMNFDAVQLFKERMDSLHPGGETALKEEDWQAIAKICGQLDGLPLAIELAAARTRVLSVGQIAARLHDRFELLRGGSRTALPRHRTLRAMIDWSHDLLPREEQVLFRRLAVFSGGWTLEAAEKVVGPTGSDIDEPKREIPTRVPATSPGGGDVLDLLSQLVSKSLVVTEHSADGVPRYLMLETIRAYAGDKLKRSGEYDQIRWRHMAFFIQLVEFTEPMLNGADQEQWIGHLEDEYENIRMAVDWALKVGDQAPERALQLVGGLKHFWDIRGRISEPRRWARRALSQAGDQRKSLAGAKTLHLAGWYAAEQGDIEEAYALLGEALEICREIGAPARLQFGYVLNDLGRLAWHENEFRKGRAIVTEALKIRKDLKDTWGIAQSLLMLGEFAMNLGELREARSLWEEGLEVARMAGDKRLLGFLLGSLGEIWEKMGALDLAYQYSLQGLSIALEINDKQLGGTELCSLADLKIRSGKGNQLAEAVQIWGAANALLREYGSSQSALSNYDEIEDRVTSLREQMGDESYEAALARGQAMDFDQAVDFVSAELKVGRLKIED